MKVKRTKVYKVRLSDEEVKRLKDEAQVQQIAKFLRDTTFFCLNESKAKKEAESKGKKHTAKKTVYFSKLERDFLLELSRIGSNLNQVAKGVNSDLARLEPLDKAKLLHLLIAINENLEALREDLK